MDIINSNLNALFIGFDTALQDALKDAPKVYEQYAMVIPSSTSTLVLPWLQLFPQFREWLGPRVVNNMALQSIQIVNKKFELTAEIERADIEDDQFGLFSTQPQRIARESGTLVDKQLALAIEANSGAGFSGSGLGPTGALSFDGVGFFATAHPVDPTNSASATQSNWYDSTHTGSAAMDLTPANVAVLRAAMMSQLGPDGLPLGIIGDTLMVPPALELKARQAANSQFYPTSVSGSAGPISNVFVGAYKVVVNPFLTDATAWYLLSTGSGVKPFIWSDRVAFEYVALTDSQNPYVFMNDKYVIGGRRRGAAACGLYYLAMKARNA